MADFFQLVTMLKEQMNATLSRSDVLKPLAWLIGILLTAIALLVYGQAPHWLLVSVVVLLVVVVVLYIGSYGYCLRYDRDALRSERYSIHKMAIEHGIYGDSRVGLIEPDKGKLIEQKAEPVTQTDEQ